MIAQSLRLHCFKNISAADCFFSPKLNCFFGLNGMGKTNLLDALHYLSFTRSHLSIPDSLAVQEGADMAILEGKYLSDEGAVEEIVLSIAPPKRKILKRNGKDYRRIAEHIGHLPLVIVSPQDYLLIQGTSSERRRFIDQFLCQQSAVYMDGLMRYNKALADRNALLKAERPDPSLLDVYEWQMAVEGAKIVAARQSFISYFVPLFFRHYRLISADSEQVSLAYRPSLSETSAESFAMALRDNRSRDLLLGYTSAGIHRDELEMNLGSRLIGKVGSQGQAKSFLISLKLAQYDHMQSVLTERPILLLDDIFDKLDSERVERIMSVVNQDSFGQIFITDTNRKHLDEMIAKQYDDYRLFVIHKGQVRTE